MSPVSSAVRTSDSGTSLPEVDAQLEGTLRLERTSAGLASALSHGALAPWNVRLITSICCSRVSRTKFTA